MRDRVPSGRGEFKPMEIPPATFEVGSSLRKLGEEVTITESKSNHISQGMWDLKPDKPSKKDGGI
jgi:hypothetical protein